jgi:hypothetical protein
MTIATSCPAPSSKPSTNLIITWLDENGERKVWTSELSQ